MDKLISDREVDALCGLSTRERVAFLLLLFERMRPQLEYFRALEHLDLAAFQRAHKAFYRALGEDSADEDFGRIREELLDATPDTEDYGSEVASLALYPALVAADIAGLLHDGGQQHIYDSLHYAAEYAYHWVDGGFIKGRGAGSLERLANEFPVPRAERRVEEQDIAFLGSLASEPWGLEVLDAIRRRIDSQEPLPQVR